MFHSTSDGCASGDGSLTLFEKPPVPPDDPVLPNPRCHPNYKNNEGVCVPNVAWPKYDVNCKGSAVYAPFYTDKKKPFKYPGPDIFNLDRDKDHWACERPAPGIILDFQ